MVCDALHEEFPQQDELRIGELKELLLAVHRASPLQLNKPIDEMWSYFERLLAEKDHYQNKELAKRFFLLLYGAFTIKQLLFQELGRWEKIVANTLVTHFTEKSEQLTTMLGSWSIKLLL